MAIEWIATSTIVEVGRMPRELYEQFAAVEDGRGFDCVGSGDFVAFTIRGADEVLLFDFYRQYWNWVPPCPYMAGSSGGRGRGRGWRAFARIAEMKELECQIAIEEVMYMLVVQKFSVAGVPMLPRLSKCIKNGKLHILLSKDRELESVHSLDMLDMIREHLSTILLSRGKTDDTDNWMTSRICRLQLGRVYAASIMYGYFLKSASFRYSLELNFARTHQDLPSGHGVHVPPLGFRQHRHENLAVLDAPANSKSSPYHGLGRSIKSEELRSYVMQFDSETLQRCAKLKSLEAVNLIEKHTWALFGNGASQIEDDEIAITFSALKRLVLEAVAFGSFLWDVERDVDSIYRLKENRQ